MATNTFCQKRPRTDCATHLSLQFYHSSTNRPSRFVKWQLLRRSFCQHWNNGTWCTTSQVRAVTRLTWERLFDSSLHVWKYLQDESSLLTLHCLTTGHTFDWDWEYIIEKEAFGHTRDFIEALNTSTACANHCATRDADYGGLRDYWCISVKQWTPAPEPHQLSLPISNVLTSMSSAVKGACTVSSRYPNVKKIWDSSYNIR